MTELSQIEQEFFDYAPELIPYLHSTIYDKKPLPSGIHSKMRSNHCCLVGESRSNLKLTTEYFSSLIYTDGNKKYKDNPNYCYECSDYAFKFLNIVDRALFPDMIVGFANPQLEYLNFLETYKQHLEKEHGKKLIKKKPKN